MPFTARWVEAARGTFDELKAAAEKGAAKKERTKTSKQEGLFKQVQKTIQLLSNNPKRPGLKTHEYEALEHPYDKKQKVFEAYAQNKTPGAYRVFWCYGPAKGEITILAITPHP